MKMFSILPRPQQTDRTPNPPGQQTNLSGNTPVEDSVEMPRERRKSPRKKPEQLSYINLENDNGGMLLNLSEQGVPFHAVSPID